MSLGPLAPEKQTRRAGRTAGFSSGALVSTTTIERDSAPVSRLKTVRRTKVQTLDGKNRHSWNYRTPQGSASFLLSADATLSLA